jgi:cell division protein FtsN
MARRDYAKRTTTRSNKKKPLPGWVWMLGGLVAGLFIAFLVYVQKQGHDAPVRAASRSKPAVTDTRTVKKKTPPPAPKKRDDGINFDFYNILPELEVVIPDLELGKDEKEKATYYLQAGSFKNKKEADSLKAELTLLNFSPSVQTVTVDNSQTWHRVRLGPFTDRRTLDKARRRLQDNGIDVIVLKEKKKEQG